MPDYFRIFPSFWNLFPYYQQMVTYRYGNPPIFSFLLKCHSTAQKMENNFTFPQNLFRFHASAANGVRLFARRTFTTPKIRTFTTPKFGHLPPPKTEHLPGGQLPPLKKNSFFLAHFSWLFRLTAH